MTDKEFVIIEQDGDGGAYITFVDDVEDYQSVGDGCFIYMKQQDYYNMCMMGVGAKWLNLQKWRNYKKRTIRLDV